MPDPSQDPLRPPPSRTGRALFVVLLLAVVVAVGVFNRDRLERIVAGWRAEPAPATSAPRLASAPAAPARSASTSASTPAQSTGLPPTPAASLPALSDSDAYVFGMIAGLLGQHDAMAWLLPRHLVLHLVATIDNLPRRQVASQIWPVRPVPGTLRVATGAGGQLALSPDNAHRYAPYLRALESVAPSRAVTGYLDLYPLFQSAWRELGNPKGQFNDRLLVVIDNLLAAPEPAPPVRLVQPKIVYQYADPTLESASTGQKILMRLGPAGEGAVKSWLRRFRQDLVARLQSPRPASAPAQ